tara:strand:- start:360 stop:608 length:249 start_codon:yes stop_codon:yes gene_type:complete
VKYLNEVKMNSERTIISVYKTSTSPENVNRLQEVLDNFTKISKWNIDLEDWENILRIESQFSIEKQIINRLNNINIFCIELH